MKLRRAITWGVAIAALVVLLAAAGLYLAAKRVPADYRPQTLSGQQKLQAQFELEKAIVDFLGLVGLVGTRDARLPAAQQPREGTLELTADELNRWVGMLPADATAALRQIGLRDPGVGVDDGRLTLYAYWDAHNMVVGIDVALVFDEDQNMTLDVKGARLGGLPVPNRMFIEHRAEIIAQLREHMRELSTRRRERFGPVPMDDLGRAGKLLTDAADGIPVRLDLPRSRGHARVSNIRLEKDKVIIEVISLLPETPQN